MKGKDKRFRVPKLLIFSISRQDNRWGFIYINMPYRLQEARKISQLLLFLREDDYIQFLCFQDLIPHPAHSFYKRQVAHYHTQTFMQPPSAETISTLLLKQGAKAVVEALGS